MIDMELFRTEVSKSRGKLSGGTYHPISSKIHEHVLFHNVIDLMVSWGTLRTVANFSA